MIITGSVRLPSGLIIWFIADSNYIFYIIDVIQMRKCPGPGWLVL